VSLGILDNTTQQRAVIHDWYHSSVKVLEDL
jgi:hypothetical protein